MASAVKTCKLFRPRSGSGSPLFDALMAFMKKNKIEKTNKKKSADDKNHGHFLACKEKTIIIG